jgi:hypothetical protein
MENSINFYQSIMEQKDMKTERRLTIVTYKTMIFTTIALCIITLISIFGI